MQNGPPGRAFFRSVCKLVVEWNKSRLLLVKQVFPNLPKAGNKHSTLAPKWIDCPIITGANVLCLFPAIGKFGSTFLTKRRLRHPHYDAWDFNIIYFIASWTNGSMCLGILRRTCKIHELWSNLRDGLGGYERCQNGPHDARWDQPTSIPSRLHPRRLLDHCRPKHLPRIRCRRICQPWNRPLVHPRRAHVLRLMRSQLALRVSLCHPRWQDSIFTLWNNMHSWMFNRIERSRKLLDNLTRINTRLLQVQHLCFPPSYLAQNKLFQLQTFSTVYW